MQLLAGEREDDTPEARSRNRVGAHGAWLAARVHARLARCIGVEPQGRPPRQLQLRMRGDVVVRQDRVAIFCEHFAPGADEQDPYG